MRKPRHQAGVVYETTNAFYIRYFETRDGERKKVSHRLCFKDKKHYSATCKSVKDLAAERMAKVNAGVEAQSNGADLLITDYWTTTYLPFVTAHLKPSTVDGYEQVWNQFLKEHFAERTLREYETHHGSQFLTGLAQKYGRRTVAHIRSLASGIFTAAINDGLLKFNPWSEVKTKIKPKAPSETKAYTLPELMDIVNNKLTSNDARLVVCLAGMMGLRPSEIVALDWQDVNSDEWNGANPSGLCARCGRHDQNRC